MANLNDLISAARDGRVSRREFLSQATALGVTLVAATTMADRAALAETPKKGGRLKIGYIQAS
ncbi:MAG: twin-arginine translocation signal domain-containing protein, partial [Gammaproteobacteria bacterium]